MRWRVCVEPGNAHRLVALTLMLCARVCCAQAQEWAGSLSIEPRVFLEDPAYPDQDGTTVALSATVTPELRFDWNNGDDRITLVPFARWDAVDSHRSHVDLREASWLHRADPWTFRVGVGRVFWGVTESRHLVDIVNQSDFVEDIDEEDKLGQPLLHAERFTRHGTFGVLLLPGFRERTFPTPDGRLGGPLPIAYGHAAFQSSAGSHHTDVALRWSDSIEEWDVGVSAFHGTGREPRLVPGTLAGTAVLVPHYDIITQLGIDLQYTREAWLWKLEAIQRSGQGAPFAAAVGGFEYTRYELGGSAMDLGILGEYLYDGRDARAPATALEHDVFIGTRLSFNDVDGTSLLTGLIIDLKSDDTIAFAEGQHRIGDHWKLEVELRWLRGADHGALSAWSRDSFVTVRLARYF